MLDFRGYNKRIFFLLAMIAMAVVCQLSFAQAPDLDLVEERTLSVALSAEDAARSRVASVVAPFSVVNGGFYVQASDISVGEVAERNLEWRVQGGPKKWGASLQFYVEGVYEERMDYAWFIRPGIVSVGVVEVSGGIGTLLRQETRQALGEVDASGDRKVKGLLFGSAHYERDVLEFALALDARLTFVPGLDGEHDYKFEPSATLDFGRLSLTGQALFGYNIGKFESDYTLLLNVPF